VVKTESDVTRLYNGTTWSGNGIMVWESDDPEFTTFAPVDTIGNLDSLVTADTTYYDVKLWSESLDWTPDGNILVGSLRKGVGWGGPLGSKWYIVDPYTGEHLDSFGEPAPDTLKWAIPGGVNGPRGGFFTDENTLYTVDYYMGTLDKWTYTVSVKEESYVPMKFALKQNYPNPFNPRTVIPFDIETKSFVKLTVYDIRGHEIGVIVDEILGTGHHEIPFEASGLASGTYIYRLEVDGKQVAKKMLYLK
jgi:hypothetical protein